MLSVLFVCTGNLCRSPMAEGFLSERSRRLLSGSVRVSSAGTWAREGSPATEEMVAMARDRGVDLEEHRATPLTGDAVRQADLVLAMARSHAKETLNLVPEAGPKTFTLKELAVLLGALAPPPLPTRESVLARIAEAHRLRTGPDGPPVPDPDVSDPIGLPEDVYRAVALDIEAGVDAVVAGLIGVPPDRLEYSTKRRRSGRKREYSRELRAATAAEEER